METENSSEASFSSRLHGSDDNTIKGDVIARSVLAHLAIALETNQDCLWTIEVQTRQTKDGKRSADISKSKYDINDLQCDSRAE